MTTRLCHKDDCDGTEVEGEAEYGSLGSGGSYAVFKCDTCGNVCRTMLSD